MRAGPQLATALLALVACTPDVLRLDVPQPEGARSLILFAASEGPGGPQHHAYASPLEDAEPIPALPLAAGTPLELRAHYYEATLDALGIRPGLLVTPAAAQPIDVLPTPARVYGTTTGDSEWESLRPESAPLAGATYTRARPADLPAHCARTRLVYEASIAESDEYPVAVHALPDGRGLIILRGGGTAGGLPIPPATAVLADPVARTYHPTTLAPELAPRSFTADDTGRLWVGGQSSQLYNLLVDGNDLRFHRVVTTTMAPSLHYLASYSMFAVNWLFAVAYEGQVYQVDRDRLVDVGAIETRDSKSDLGDVVALDEQRVAVAFATRPTITVFELGTGTALGTGSSAAGYLSLVRLDAAAVLAGGADGTLSLVRAGRAPEVQVIPGADGQWVRTLVQIGDSFWWGGKFGRGGQYVLGHTPCPPLTLGGHNIRKIVRWGERGMLVAMEGTGDRGPSFAFHEILAE